jgi:hypothetical protein
VHAVTTKKNNLLAIETGGQQLNFGRTMFCIAVKEKSALFVFPSHKIVV